ncbi:MAG: TolC family protein, partial [Pseudomonadota bacterium]
MRSFLVLALLVAASAPAHAETLQEAIAAAYATNPDLASSRAGQRLSAEDAVLARNQLFPTIGANAVFDQQTFNPGNFGDQSRFVGSTVRLTQPVYRGGQTISNIKATKKRLLSGREQLRATENQLVFDTVQAYMNVLANQSEVELNASNVRVLERQLQASSDRFEVGDVTRTDVAQSEARLALARSQLIAAEAALDAASYTFERIVGHVPQNLQPPPPTPPLPGTAQQAIDLALSESPSVISARLGEQASRFEVNAARG